LFQKISILPPQRVVWVGTPRPLTPLKIPVEVLYFPLKILGFDIPSPSECAVTLCGGGMDIFWNHTIEGSSDNFEKCSVT